MDSGHTLLSKKPSRMGSEPSADFCQKVWGAKFSKRDYFPLPAPQFGIKRSVLQRDSRRHSHHKERTDMIHKMLMLPVAPAEPCVICGVGLSVIGEAWAFAQDEEGGRFVGLEPCCSFFAGEEVEAQEHEHFVGMGDCVLAELEGEAIWRVGDDALAVCVVL